MTNEPKDNDKKPIEAASIPRQKPLTRAGLDGSVLGLALGRPVFGFVAPPKSPKKEDD